MRWLWVAIAGCGTSPPVISSQVQTVEQPMLIASVGGTTISVAEVDASGVHSLGEIAIDDARVGWLDRHTLIAFQPNGKDAPAITKIVNGKQVGRYRVDGRWSIAGMALTGTSDVWLQHCEVEIPERQDCAKWEVLHVLPLPTQLSSMAAMHGSMHSLAISDPTYMDLPRQPDAHGPAGVTLDIVEYASNQTRATCTKGDAEPVQYPEGSTGMPLVVKSVRWVIADPPIYEVVYAEDNGIGIMQPSTKYFRPCEATPLDAIVLFPHAIWAERVDAQWIFRVGPAEIGRMPYGELAFAP
jgi:hypothetical protein